MRASTRAPACIGPPQEDTERARDRMEAARTAAAPMTKVLELHPSCTLHYRDPSKRKARGLSQKKGSGGKERQTRNKAKGGRTNKKINHRRARQRGFQSPPSGVSANLVQHLTCTNPTSLHLDALHPGSRIEDTSLAVSQRLSPQGMSPHAGQRTRTQQD